MIGPKKLLEPPISVDKPNQTKPNLFIEIQCKKFSNFDHFLEIQLSIDDNQLVGDYYYYNNNKQTKKNKKKTEKKQKTSSKKVKKMKKLSKPLLTRVILIICQSEWIIFDHNEKG